MNIIEIFENLSQKRCSCRFCGAKWRKRYWGYL